MPRVTTAEAGALRWRSTSRAARAATRRSAAKKRVERIGEAVTGGGRIRPAWTHRVDASDRPGRPLPRLAGPLRVYPAGLRIGPCRFRRLARRARAGGSRTSTCRRSRSTPPSSAAAGRGLAPSTIARRLAAVRSYIGFTLGAARVPAIALPPRRRRRLPDAPKLAEVEAILATADGEGPLAVRNAAMLELTYSCGLRTAEVVGLRLADVDFEQEAVHVLGKGGKERIVPLGERAAHAVATYLRDARPSLARGANDTLFLSVRGRRARHLGPPPPDAQSPPAAPRLRDAPARGRGRPAHDPGAPRARLALDDAGLQPRRRTPAAARVRQQPPALVGVRLGAASLAQAARHAESGRAA